MAFKVGETVVLKSGGPVMTVEYINGDGTVRCVWFDKKDTRCVGAFPPETLEEGSNEPVLPRFG